MRNLSTYPLRQIRIPLAGGDVSPVRVTTRPKRRWRGQQEKAMWRSDLVPLQESATRRYETLGTLVRVAIPSLTWDSHIMLIHFTWLRKAGTKQCRIQCPARDGDPESHLKARRFLGTPPQLPDPSEQTSLRVADFPPPPPSSASTPLTHPAAPGALLRAEIQGGLSRSQLRLLMTAVLETAEKEAAASAVVSLHSASALRSTGYCQQPKSTAMDG